MVAFMAATAINAQVVLWDGEDKEVGSDGGFWNRSTPTVVEEDGNKCLKATLSSEGEEWERQNIALGLGDYNLKGLRRVTMRIKMAEGHNVKVKLGKDGAYVLERLAWCDPNDWKILVLEFGEGPDNDKVVDEGNTFLEIWPFENYDASKNGQVVYIDDIKVEGTLVDDIAVRTKADNSLDGDVVVTGTIGKGTFQCTWDGDWHPQAYDDYAMLAAKLAPTAKTLDVRGAGHWDEDWDVIKTKCPEIKIILTDEDVPPTDGITQATTNDLQPTTIYNLAGQRVMNPQHGLYIVNGKKVMMK